MNQTFKKYDRAIILEDDNLVSSNFLEFMNNSLEIYKDNKGDSLIVPNNYAHGYECLSQTCKVLYHLDNYRNIRGENGIFYKDKDLNIKSTTKKPIISKRDKLSKSFILFKKSIKTL